MGIELENIATDSNWGVEAPKINTNNQKLVTEIIKAQNGEGLIKYYNTSADLNTLRPNPSNGEQAWVGTPYPGRVWNVVDGVWTDTTVVPDVNTVDLSGYLPTGGTTKTGAQLDAEITQLDTDIEKLDTEFTQNGIKLQYGTNRLNPNYTDGFNKGLDTNGNIIASTGWYVTPPIRWDGETSLLCQRYRLSCQYDAAGKFVAGSYNITSSGSTELNITVNKASGAVYMRMMLPMTNKDISMIVTGTVMPSPYVPFKQVVSTDLNGGATVFIPNISIDEKLQQWILGESFKLTSTPTYTDGLLNTPITVQYPDGGTGSVTVVRNPDSYVTSIEGTHTEGNRKITITLTRDISGNVLTQNITFQNIT